jgi:hypothetical protein
VAKLLVDGLEPSLRLCTQSLVAVPQCPLQLLEEGMAALLEPGAQAGCQLAALSLSFLDEAGETLAHSFVQQLLELAEVSLQKPKQALSLSLCNVLLQRT